MQTFLQGRGELLFRIPVADFQEEQLRSKVQSKLLVASLLAGFTATILFQLLLQETRQDMSLLQEIGAISLTGSLALFIASIYIYDQLSMPEGFWVFGSSRSKWSIVRIWQSVTSYLSENLRPGLKGLNKDGENCGPMYAYMVWTWTYVFTPAIMLSVLGFLLLLFETEDSLIIGGGIGIIMLIGIYYIIARPSLATD